MLPLPMTPETCLAEVIVPALRHLPSYLDSPQARVLMLACMIQESNLNARWQIVDPKNPGKRGPARGLAQFELIGVMGVYKHRATNEMLRMLCRDLDVNFDPKAIYGMLEHSDTLAAALTRLLIYTDPKPLPARGDEEGAWEYYLRCWRPGAYTNGTPEARLKLRKKWGRAHEKAREVVL